MAYKMMTNAAPLMLATPSSLLQARGGFALKNLWVTPHSEAERWPAGSYTIQSRGGEGLPEWAKQVLPLPMVLTLCSGQGCAAQDACRPGTCTAGMVMAMAVLEQIWSG